MCMKQSEEKRLDEHTGTADTPMHEVAADRKWASAHAAYSVWEK